MDEWRMFCPTCNTERKVEEVQLDEQGKMSRLSCGHRIIEVKFKEDIGLTERLNWKHRRPGYKKPVGEGKVRERLSGEAKRPARVNIIIDRLKRKKIHKVWEQLDSGEWELVHDEEEPFPESGNN
jgi:ribosomal protein L44E